MVGNGYFLPGLVRNAFLYSDDRIQDIGDFDVTALNDNGQIVGDNTIGHAVLYSGGKMRDLGTLGGTSSHALGINNRGVIVGYSFPVGYGGGVYDPNSLAFVYIEGHMHDLNTLLTANPVGWTLIEAVGVNDLGQIAVAGVTPGWSLPNGGGTLHALILTPVQVKGSEPLK